jgi:hypothetical protein
MSRYPQRRDPRTGKTYYVHRATAEWHLGRLLEPGEVVHNRDENWQDDHPDNLRVLPSQRAHMVLHGICGARRGGFNTCSGWSSGSSCEGRFRRQAAEGERSRLPPTQVAIY